MSRKIIQAEKFDFEKMKSAIKERYGITYDDTTLGVIAILQENIEKLSSGREFELSKLLKEIEFLKNLAYSAKREQEGRDKQISHDIRACTSFVTVLLLAACLLFWQYQSVMDDNMEETRSSINNKVLPAILANQQFLDSLLHRK